MAKRDQDKLRQHMAAVASQPYTDAEETSVVKHVDGIAKKDGNEADHVEALKAKLQDPSTAELVVDAFTRTLTSVPEKDRVLVVVTLIACGTLLGLGLIILKAMGVW